MNNLKNFVPTPYQGKKRCFGEFVCQNCAKSWKSANSKANTPQECTRCHTYVFPSKQSSLDNVFKELRNNREIKFAYLDQMTKQAQPKQENLSQKPINPPSFMHHQTSMGPFSYHIEKFSSVSPTSSNSSINSSSPSFFIKPNPITAFDFQDCFQGICRL